MSQRHPPRIWGTFSLSGGAGASTTAYYLALAAKNLGVAPLLVEGDCLNRHNDQFPKQERSWESYKQLEMRLPPNAFPSPLTSGITYLAFNEFVENSSKSVSYLLDGAADNFDLVIVDLPRHFSEFTLALIEKISLLNAIGISGTNTVRSFNRIKNNTTKMQFHNLCLRTLRNSNLSAEESMYQMGFDGCLKLPESESVKNLETYNVLPTSKDPLMKIFQSFVNSNL